MCMPLSPLCSMLAIHLIPSAHFAGAKLGRIPISIIAGPREEVSVVMVIIRGGNYAIICPIMRIFKDVLQWLAC